MKKNLFYITVSSNYNGYRIDKFLQSQINQISRTSLQRLIYEGEVKVNNILINDAAKKNKRKRYNKN